MKILYLHQYFNTPDTPGSTRSYEMARRLVDAGHEVHMITSDYRRTDGAQDSRWSEGIVAGIHVHAVRVPYANRMGFAARMKAFLAFAWHSGRRAAAVGGDLVFATSTPLTITLPGVYAARRLRVPLVFEVRDLWPAVPIAMGVLRGRAAIAAARWLERFAYRNSRRIVALSPDMKRGVVDAGYPPESVTVIPNGSDVDLFDVGPGPGQAIREARSWLGDRPLVLYAGALGMVNGVGYLVRTAAAMARLDPEVRFVVLGQGREEEQVRREAKEAGVLGRSFFMLPPVTKREIAAWMSAADVTTSVVIDLPALWANSANKFFDSFAASRPIAINHDGWQADLLRETGAGLVLPAGDPEGAAAALLEFLRDEERLAAARRAARELADERFGRDLLAARLETVLRAAAEPEPTPERELQSA